MLNKSNFRCVRATIGLFFIIHKQQCKTESIVDSGDDNNNFSIYIYLYNGIQNIVVHVDNNTPQ